MSVLTPNQTHRGVESLFPDAAIAIANAVIALGSDDHHFAAYADATKIPRGIVMHDLVSTNDATYGIAKDIAIFGLYHESLQCVASGAIEAGADVIPDPANPGQVMQIPNTSGTFWVIGKSRFNVSSAGDPCSLIHCTPRQVTVGGTEVWVAPPANSGSEGTQGQQAFDGNNVYQCVATNTWIKLVAVTQFLILFAFVLLGLMTSKANAADGDLILLQSSGTGTTVVQTIATPVAANQVVVTGSTNKILKTTNVIPLGNNATLQTGVASPVSTVTANPGSLYIAVVSGTATLYLKNTGTDATGWVAK